MKNKYDTSVVFLYAIGKEHLLPKEFRSKIPYTTISNWRKTDYSKYIGHEFRYFFDEAFDKAEISFKYKRIKGLTSGLARSWVTLSPLIKPIIKSAAREKDMQKKILESIGFLKNHLGLEQTLKLIGISHNLYRQWMLEARFNCFDSFTSLCVKRYPHQLELKEVEKIKNMLRTPEFDHWPIVSIAGICLRNEKIIASLFTWYKYANIFGISKKLVKKDHKTIGLVANYPNEYLHVDTTYYPLIDGKNICITFVMDNYSKMILGFEVAESLSFAVVKQALARALEVIMKHPDQQHSYLVADGGRENHNKNIDEFIAKLSGHKITKIRALKDIRFSNSPVEAVHRTIKGRYLRNRKFESVEAIFKYLEWAVYDYNMIRPHYKHRPRTPNEVYFNIQLGFNIRKRVEKAMKARVENNKCAKCTDCQSTLCKKA